MITHQSVNRIQNKNNHNQGDYKMSNNFKLQFGNKNVLVQYNDAQDARVFTYGEDGRNGEATQFARALHHMMAGT
jgi:hypothetical protein